MLRTRGHTPGRDRAVGAYSALGEHALGWIALGLAGGRLSADPARAQAWRRGAGTVVAAYLANQALKRVVARPRPQLADLPPLTHTMSQLSFPSAHSTTSFAAARVYGGLAPAGALYGVAGTLALSRLYLGVHYPSDVLAGAALGSLIGELGRR
ncbi:phosphatase PAP2 family protein [Conexibacter sp. DBS9H8]|uniref:phosphatase PAP2 family protein n=1 Tax=Conexibacter sp. DBS9H8 TaxID=2937801 RepID=UPI0020104861|nr:phosphatase PAP2 family protein [Conexibacter sp. DBS9H8]